MIIQARYPTNKGHLVVGAWLRNAMWPRQAAIHMLIWKTLFIVAANPVFPIELQIPQILSKHILSFMRSIFFVWGETPP